MVNKKIFAVVLLFAAKFLGAMDQDTKFYLQIEGERIEITRAGLELSKKLKGLVEDFGDDEKLFDEDKNEFVIDLGILVPFSEDISSGDIKFFVKLCDGNDREFDQTLKSIKDEVLVKLILLTDFLITTKMEDHTPTRYVFDLLLEEFATRMKKENYIKFLNGKGLLWHAVEKIHSNILKEIKPRDLRHMFFNEGTLVWISSTEFKNVSSFEFFGKMVWVLFEDNKLVLFGISTKKELKSFENVRSFYISPDKKTVGIVYKNSRGVLFDIFTKKELMSFDDVDFFKFSPDKKTLGIMYKTNFDDRDNKLVLFDISTKKELKSFDHVRSFYISPDKKTVGIVYKDSRGVLFDTSTKKELKSFDNVRFFDFSPDKKTVGIVHEDSRGVLFDIFTSKELKSFDDVDFFKFSPDLSLVAFESSLRPISVRSEFNIYRVSDFSLIKKVRSNSHFEFLPDGNSVVIGDNKQNILFKNIFEDYEKELFFKNFYEFGPKTFKFLSDGKFFGAVFYDNVLKIGKIIDFSGPLSFEQAVLFRILQLWKEDNRSVVLVSKKIMNNDVLFNILNSFGMKIFDRLNDVGFIKITTKEFNEKRKKKEKQKEEYLKRQSKEEKREKQDAAEKKRDEEIMKMISSLDQKTKKHIKAFRALLKDVKDENDLELPSLFLKKIKKLVKDQGLIEELLYDYNRVASKFDEEEGEE